MEPTLATPQSPAPSPSELTFTPPAPHRDQTLHRLLDAELDYSPHAIGPYISHLSMSLVAAHRLGADEQTLEAWYRAQTSDDFLVPRTRPAWLEPDTAAIVERGIAAAVSDQLPALVGSPSSQFFHAIIRLELAVDAGHPGQVANALRNWADANTPISPTPSGHGRSTFTEVLSRLAAADQPSAGSGLDLGRVASSPEFARTMGELMTYETLLDDVASTVAEHHTEPGGFGTLHLVTGTRAARALIGYLDGPAATELALRTAQAVAAALVGLGQLTIDTAASETVTTATATTDTVSPDASNTDDTTDTTDTATTDRPATDIATFTASATNSHTTARATTRRARPAADEVAPWDAINRRAIESGDPHVAKLVYACFLEERATGRPIHREVAARQVGLSSPSST